MSKNASYNFKNANIENLKVTNISGNLPFSDSINVKGRMFLNQTEYPKYDNELVTKKYVDERVNTSIDELDVVSVDKNTSFIDYKNIQNNFYTHIGGIDDEMSSQTGIDISGNVYMSGLFKSSELNIYDSTNNSVPVTNLYSDSNNTSLFLTKYDNIGINQWKVKINGTDSKHTPTIYTNAYGNSFVAMQSYETINTNIYDTTSPEPVKVLSGYDHLDTIVVKYDTNGIFKFNLRIKTYDVESNNNTSNATVTCDLSDNIYVVGYYNGSSFDVYDASSDSVPIHRYSNPFNSGGGSYFILKFNKQGKFLWRNHLQGGLIPGEAFNNPDYYRNFNININCDNSGNLYLTSTYYDNVGIFNASPASIDESDSDNDETETQLLDIILNPSYAFGTFTIKYNSKGRYLWHNKILHLTNNEYNGGFQTNNCLDMNGNMYLTFTSVYTYTYGVYDTDSSSVPKYTFNNTDYSDSFISVLKMDMNGKFVWNNVICSNNSYQYEFMSSPSICCDNRYVRETSIPSIYLHFVGNNEFFNNGFNFYNANDLKHIAFILEGKQYYLEDYSIHGIIAKYSIDGDFQWATSSATHQYEEGIQIITNSIQADKYGHIYISGIYYNSTLYIWDVSKDGVNDEPVAELNNSGGSDIYLIKYNRYGLLNDNLHRNVYIEDNCIIPNAYEKSIVITNNCNNGPINCNILEKSKSGYGYNVRRNIVITDALDLVMNNCKWTPKLQTDQPSISYDVDVMDPNTKLSLVEYHNLTSMSFAERIIGSGNERDIRFSTDKYSNLYIVGSYTSNQIYFPYLTRVSQFDFSNKDGNTDIFIAKYDSCGNVNWCTHIGTDKDEYNTPAITTDENGNVYLTYVAGFYGGEYTINIFDTRDNNDRRKQLRVTDYATVVIAYDKDGIFKWNVVINGWYDYDVGTSDSASAVDKYGNLYVTGYYYATGLSTTGVNIYDSADELTTAFEASTNEKGMFITKFDNKGKLKWVTNIHGGLETQWKTAISSDCDGNIVVSSILGGSTNINNIIDGSSVLYKSFSAPYGFTTLLVKYDTNGKFIWNTFFAATPNVDYNLPGGAIYPVSVMDADSNLYIAAQLYGTNTALYDTRSETNVRVNVYLPNVPQFNTLLIKYNKNGIIQWYTYVSGESNLPNLSIDNRFTKGINNSNIYLSGTFRGNSGEPSRLYFYSSSIDGQPNYTGYYLDQIAYNDVYLVKFNKDGLFDWCTKVGGNDDDTNSAVCATPDGHVYLGGEFKSTTINIYQGSTTGMDANNYIATTIDNYDITGSTYDLFLVKYNKFGIVNKSNYRYGYEIYLQNNPALPDGTEKTIVITNNITTNNTTPDNICLIVLDTNYSGYTAFRTLWFCEGITMVSYNGQWFMKSASTGDGLPKRSIIMWGGDNSEIPNGWRLCDGGSLNGCITPDLRGRFVLSFNPNVSIASDSSGNRAPINVVNTYGGELNHQLKLGEIPAHKHGVTDPGHRHGYQNQAYDQGTDNAFNTETAASYQDLNQLTTTNVTGISINWNGGHNSLVDGSSNLAPNIAYTETHNNMPPYYVLAYIMKCY